MHHDPSVEVFPVGVLVREAVEVFFRQVGLDDEVRRLERYLHSRILSYGADLPARPIESLKRRSIQGCFSVSAPIGSRSRLGPAPSATARNRRCCPVPWVRLSCRSAMPDPLMQS